MKLTILGTGHAMVSKCYNTCFAMSDSGETLLVDGGGGQGILMQLNRAGIDPSGIKSLYITHKHTDHILGMIIMARYIMDAMSKGKYGGDATIYGHNEVLEIIEKISRMLLQEKLTKFIDNGLKLQPVTDGESVTLLGHSFTFFDIHSAKAKQYGFSVKLADGRKLTCCGDEPFSEPEEEYVRDADWLLHEAFCLSSQADIYKPYEKKHSTVKDACEIAQKHNVKNLLLYHTEDDNLENRKQLYTNEGKQYFTGNLFVPDDLETFVI